MADEDEKGKATVSSLGEGCLTLIAVYVGAVVVALVITQFQRHDPSKAWRTPQTTVRQDEPAVIQGDDPSDPGAYFSPVPSATIDPPTPDVTASFPPSVVAPEMQPSVPAPAGTGVLRTQDENSSVNVRAFPNLSAEIVHVGYGGDAVNILNQSIDSEGNTWYYVEFADGSATGWVHGDYLQPTMAEPNSYPSPEGELPSVDQNPVVSTQ
ncbi:MAG: SH3 domain-containing protein [Synechococcales cyanobacterium T60_A2020_003]|nr:SH3 domain-containing protein [Synechococcales cyanobacterium T60_A2020_003]